MKRKYLTISEFAKLRNVSIGSLRYYEKLQILTPAYVNPETGYRYYLPEQLRTLDAILSCIDLDIPLKELNSFVDENGVLDQKSLLSKAKQTMQEKINTMQEKLDLTQFNLDSIEQNQQYSNQTQLYTRRIEERYFFAEAISDGWQVIAPDGTNRPLELFKEAEQADMTPVFPAGVLICYEPDSVQVFLYFQVLRPDPGNPHVFSVPAGEYTCLQENLTSETDIKRVLAKHFTNQRKKLLVISNMLLNKTHFDSLHSEIQVLEEPS